jgi:bifunctional UDP-N-acetylglucosamine pyrophosphorylase / glucosamine-1-phosphate N-acetyltransferase
VRVNVVSNIEAVVLAAGQGKRMKSALPKVLHRICGQPMVAYVLDTLKALGVASPVVVVGYGAETVREALGNRARYAIQAERLGTGHAVMQAVPHIRPEAGTVLVLNGDLPFVTADTLARLLEMHREARAAATILTDVWDDPAGYGRVLRDSRGYVQRIVEDRDATEDERVVREINVGAYAFELDPLRRALDGLQPVNAQGEYYLTDVFTVLLKSSQTVAAVTAASHREAAGINSRVELAEAEATMRASILEALMLSGVTVIDPRNTYVHAGVQVGSDTIIHPGSHLEGRTIVGERCEIGPATRLVDAELGNGVTVTSSTVQGSVVGEGTTIGPYSRLRPGVRVGRFVEIGNYAEMKNVTVGDRTKIHHMSYLGDATIGSDVNIGAGTVTCNYDGRAKHHTTIEDSAFIGSDTMLIAPVTIGRGGVTGAGSVVKRDVPPGGVAVGVPARVIRHVVDVPAPAPPSRKR